MTIHPTAVVEAQAEVHPEATIGPFCYVAAGAIIKAGAELRNNATVYGGATIGEETLIFPGAVIAGDPQDLKFRGENSRVEIGARCRIHECATVNKGTESGGMLTSVGDDVLLMAYAHIAHDCHVGNNVVIGNNSQLAGHIKVEDRAIISGMAGIHHFATVGELAFVSGMSAVRSDVPPFTMVDGRPSEVRNLNLVGLRRAGLSDEEVRELRGVYRELFNRKDGKPKADVVADLRTRLIDPSSYVTRLIDWVDQQVSVSVKGRVQEAFRG